MLIVKDDNNQQLTFDSENTGVGLDTDNTIFLSLDSARIEFTLEETLVLAKFFTVVSPEALRDTVEEQLSATDEEFEEGEE